MKIDKYRALPVKEKIGRLESENFWPKEPKLAEFLS